MLASEREFNVTENDLKELLHLADLLHLFHHRNKNQHRRSIWYRHFSLFRRQLSQFTQDLTNLDATATTNVGRARKKLQDAQTITRTQARLTFWRDVMVARWQHAFSQVIADGRFSVLGLVLTAVLAQVCQIAGITAELEDLGQEEVERVLNEFGKKEQDWDEATPLARPAKDVAEDQGEVILRKAQEDLPNAVMENKKTTNSPHALETTGKVKLSRKRPAEATSKPKKKRKKTGDAIDDIFG